MIAPPVPPVLDARWLDAFVVFAEHRNFTRAARALHLSQPALHAQITRLSEFLGVPLYRREGRHLELTVQGKRVAAFGRDARERALALCDELRHGTGRQPVTLCAGEGAYLYLLGAAIGRFAARDAAPLRLLTRDRDATIEAVRTGEAHLGVASLDGVPDDLVAERLTDVEQVLAVPSDHPLARKRTVRLTDLAGAKLIVPSLDRPHRAMLTGALANARVPWEVAVEANGWALMLHFTALGVGLSVVNACCTLPPGVVARPLRELPARRYDVLRRRGSDDGGAAGVLRRVLLASGSAWKKRDGGV